MTSTSRSSTSRLSRQVTLSSFLRSTSSGVTWDEADCDDRGALRPLPLVRALLVINTELSISSSKLAVYIQHVLAFLCAVLLAFRLARAASERGADGFSLLSNTIHKAVTLAIHVFMVLTFSPLVDVQHKPFQTALSAHVPMVRAIAAATPSPTPAVVPPSTPARVVSADDGAHPTTYRARQALGRPLQPDSGIESYAEHEERAVFEHFYPNVQKSSLVMYIFLGVLPCAVFAAPRLAELFGGEQCGDVCVSSPVDDWFVDRFGRSALLVVLVISDFFVLSCAVTLLIIVSAHYSLFVQPLKLLLISITKQHSVAGARASSSGVGDLHSIQVEVRDDDEDDDSDSTAAGGGGGAAAQAPAKRVRTLGARTSSSRRFTDLPREPRRFSEIKSPTQDGFSHNIKALGAIKDAHRRADDKYVVLIGVVFALAVIGVGARALQLIATEGDEPGNSPLLTIGLTAVAFATINLLYRKSLRLQVHIKKLLLDNKVKELDVPAGVIAHDVAGRSISLVPSSIAGADGGNDPASEQDSLDGKLSTLDMNEELLAEQARANEQYEGRSRTTMLVLRWYVKQMIGDGLLVALTMLALAVMRLYMSWARCKTVNPDDLSLGENNCRPHGKNDAADRLDNYTISLAAVAFFPAVVLLLAMGKRGKDHILLVLRNVLVVYIASLVLSMYLVEVESFRTSSTSLSYVSNGALLVSAILNTAYFSRVVSQAPGARDSALRMFSVVGSCFVVLSVGDMMYRRVLVRQYTNSQNDAARFSIVVALHPIASVFFKTALRVILGRIRTAGIRVGLVTFVIGMAQLYFTTFQRFFLSNIDSLGIVLVSVIIKAFEDVFFFSTAWTRSYILGRVLHKGKQDAGWKRAEEWRTSAITPNEIYMDQLTELSATIFSVVFSAWVRSYRLEAPQIDLVVASLVLQFAGTALAGMVSVYTLVAWQDTPMLSRWKVEAKSYRRFVLLSPILPVVTMFSIIAIIHSQFKL